MAFSHYPADSAVHHIIISFETMVFHPPSRDLENQCRKALESFWQMAVAQHFTKTHMTIKQCVNRYKNKTAKPE